MPNEWKELTELTRGKAISVERVRVLESNIAIEGSFELPALAQLPMDDQVFIGAFVRSHGSIKDMERLFGSATRPSRTGSIGSLRRSAWEWASRISPPRPAGIEILDRLERGDITPQEAMEALKK